MIERLQGIVLRTVKYSDNDMMVDMFTDMRGRTTFNVRVARKSRSLSSASLWRPLSLVEFDTDFARWEIIALKPTESVDRTLT